MKEPITATYILMRQAEFDARMVDLGNRFIAPYVKRVTSVLFSNRFKAVYFGLKRQPVTDDMAQMLSDIEETSHA